MGVLWKKEVGSVFFIFLLSSQFPFSSIKVRLINVNSGTARL